MRENPLKAAWESYGDHLAPSIHTRYKVLSLAPTLLILIVTTSVVQRYGKKRIGNASFLLTRNE